MIDFRKIGLVIASLASLGTASGAESWWNKEWTARRKLTVDLAALTTMSQPVNAPVLIRLHDANFGFSGKEDGSDFRVYAADDKTAVPFHLERYDGFLNKQAYLWVYPGELAKGTKTQLNLYFGNLKPETISVSDAKAVLDSATVLCYHFADQGTPVDSSASGINATTPSVWVEGSFIGGGIRFENTTDVQLPANPAISFGANAPATWSAWIKPSALAAGSIVTYGKSAQGVSVGMDAAGILTLKAAGQSAVASTALALNAWVHLGLVAEPNKLTVFADGKPVATLGAGWPAVEAGAFTLGKNDSEPSFVGEMDEMQLSNVARDESWLAFSAFTQSGTSQEKVISFDAEEMANLSWLDGKSTSAILIKNLTVDGWIVIVLCVVMSIGSWIIMVSKVRLLNRINKGNAFFMEQWKKLSRDITSLDNTDADHVRSMGGRLGKDEIKQMRNSSVYRLYHIGSDELGHRLQAEGGVDAGVSARSMEAIKATMDGGLVREGQRLNKLVVLLTICISGGPFLGLLGTVIGVMVTFAAIAAEGAVDVNNIAPGIAGALLATVAGLAVAIPALFGYNYILAKVKEAQADMSVFIDEFVTRMAENYPDAKGSH